VSRFLPLDRFRADVDRLVDDVHASEVAPGFERVLVPGELEAERRAERLEHGIPLPDELVVELDQLATELDRPPLTTEVPA
jgi:LDH2 family malate/lactate/ureidoglycolate dehydrogenase